MTSTTAHDALKISWIDRREDLVPLYTEWHELAKRTGADIYLTPDWFDVWWTHFGASRRLSCLVAHQGLQLVAVLPFSIETVWLGPVPVRLARLAGMDPHCMIFRLPLEPELSESLLHTALDQLWDVQRCHAISFTPVSDLSDLGPLLRSTCTNDVHLSLVDMPEGDHVIFDLPARFEDFLGGLSKKRRGQFRRDMKGLEDSFGQKTHVSYPTAAEFAEFVSFHNTQWQAVGKGGHFRDWPGSTVFYPDLAERTLGSQVVQLHMQTGSQAPLASQFALIAGLTAHWRLPARTLDPEAEKLSVGKVGLLLMIEALIAQGVTRIEAGRGEYDYKLSYGGQSIGVRRMIVSPATRVGRLRLRLLLGWADLLNLVYYRIWFLKISPRLRRLTGGQSRPLWRSWIRTRL